MEVIQRDMDKPGKGDIEACSGDMWMEQELESAYQSPVPKRSVCGRWAWYNPATGNQARFLCGNRSCKRTECSRIYQWRRRKLIFALTVKYGLFTFYTLTLPGDMDSDSSWKEVGAIWNRARKRIKDRYSELLYVSVLEAQKRGVAHIHGFCNTYLDVNWLRGVWTQSGGGQQMKLLILDNESVASAYATKYVGKDKLVPKGQRSLWRSIGMKADFELAKGSEWRIIKDNIYDLEGKPMYEVRLEDS